MITATERDYLKESIEKELKVTQKLIAKLTKEVTEADQILQTKRDKKDQLTIKLNELQQMKLHVESVIL
jgi:uncharacterized coiled-coil protein SlyX